jgi:hypothetical protein
MVTSLALLLAAVTVLTPSVPRLRGASPRETAIIADLLARSPTARTLAAGLSSVDVIVYVRIDTKLPKGHGATRFVTSTAAARFVRISLAPAGHADDLAALLAHELQHVLEIARAPDVIDSRGVQRLYRAIGNDRSAMSAFETVAAQEVTRQVRGELAHRSGGASDRPLGHP